MDTKQTLQPYEIAPGEFNRVVEKIVDYHENNDRTLYAVANTERSLRNRALGAFIGVALLAGGGYLLGDSATRESVNQTHTNVNYIHTIDQTRENVGDPPLQP